MAVMDMTTRIVVGRRLHSIPTWLNVVFDENIENFYWSQSKSVIPTTSVSNGTSKTAKAVKKRQSIGFNAATKKRKSP
jgi:hypothetical protein